jgi:Ca-dependent carbohydrate-binding module xylan-binding
MSGSTNSSNVIGSGSDSITLDMAEDQALGVDAQFTVNVDGQQIGGVQTVTASQAAGQTEAFTFDGNWAPGTHNVTVTFVNNFIYPGMSGDRNVFVDGVSYDGHSVSNATTEISQTPFFPPNSTTGNNYGNAVFQVNDTTPIPSGAASTPTTSPAPVSIGSGPDTLVLNMAEDPFQGNAQFTVSVDGQQIGGVQTTSAVVDDGQFQEFDVHGNFGQGGHQVSIDYLNDAVGGFYPAGTPGLPPGGPWALDTEDRNLYVMGMSLDGGQPTSGAPWEISSDGTATFDVGAGTNPSATAYNSGLFASDGAAATSDNAAIPSGSLAPGASSTGSSSGMSFVAPSTTSSGTTASSDPSGGSTSTSSSGGSSTSASAPAPSVATAASGTGTTPSPQDFTAPSTSSSSGSDPSGSTHGSGHQWWGNHDTAHVAGSTFHQHG